MGWNGAKTETVETVLDVVALDHLIRCRKPLMKRSIEHLVHMTPGFMKAFTVRAFGASAAKRDRG